ncbi:hypothetical protein SBADM41S_08967 [Streptomyces badius]
MAVAQGPPAFLLDEPTAYLDLVHQIDVLDLVGRHDAGRTAHQPVCHKLRAISAIAAIASGSEDPAEARTSPVRGRSPGRIPASRNRRPEWR